MSEEQTATTTAPVLEVQRRKVANVFRGAPWIFPNAVRNGPDEPGLLKVVTETGRFVGWADYNPQAPVPGRLLSRGEDWPGEEVWLRLRLQSALERRMRLGYSFGGGGVRLVNGEGDGMPGLVIDAYGTTMVYDFYTRAMRERGELIVQILKPQFSDYHHVMRMGRDAAEREHCEPLEPATTEIIFGENGLCFQAQLDASQKTGFYLDQRDNRRFIARCAAGRRVLDLFAYHAAFSLSALAAGARSALAVDSSTEALATAMKDAERNGLSLMTSEADVFSSLPEIAKHGPFDMIICDPPKMAPSRKHREKGLGAYRRLCRQCLPMLGQGGLLLLSSCSQAIDTDDLRGILGQISSRQRLALDVVAITHQPADHPWPVGFLTGRYLSTVIVERRGQM